jgi:hypothetical protein
MTSKSIPRLSISASSARFPASREFFEEQSQIVDVVLLLLDHDDGEVAIR